MGGVVTGDPSCLRFLILKTVRQSLAAGWHEGFEPTREHVENLTDYVLGLIDDSEYERRSRAMVKRLLQNTNSKPTSL